MYIGDIVDRLLSSDTLENLGVRTRASGHPDLWGALGSFGAGLLVGSVLGLLFAPKPGSELRREFRQRAHDLRGNSRDEEQSPEDPATPPS
jgi:hypothetical protein